MSKIRYSWVIDGNVLSVSSCFFPSKSICVLISFYKDTSFIGLGSMHMTSFYFN